MAKIITRITSDNVISLNGTALRIGEEGGTTTAYSADQLRPAEYSSSGNRITLRRESDGSTILQSVLFSEIKNGNTGQLFASADELQQYMLKFQVGDAEPGNGQTVVTPVELDTDYWDFFEAPAAKKYLDHDQNLKTLNDDDEGFTGVLEVIQRGKGGYKLSINTTDIGINPTGSTFIVARVGDGKKVNIFSDSPLADNEPFIITQPESKRTVVNDQANLYAKAVNYDKVELIYKNAIISNSPAETITVGPDTQGSYVFRFYKGNKILDSDPAVISLAEAEPLTFNSQPDDAIVDVGGSYTFLPDVSSVPPARVTLYSVDGSTNKKIADVPASGYVGVINDTLTYKYGAVYQLPGEPAEPPVYSETFTVTANKLVQAPPTNPVNDDTADTFGWTDAPGKSYLDVLISINGGNFVQAVSNPNPVGDLDISTGQVKIKYKETATHNESIPLTNTVAFNTTVVPTDWTLTSDSVNIKQTGTVFTSTVQGGTPGYPAFDVIKNKSFKPGTLRKFRVKYNSNLTYGEMGIKTTPTAGNPTDDLIHIGITTGLYSLMYGVNGVISVQLSNSIPYLEVIIDENNNVKGQCLNADQSVFVVLDTSDIPPVTVETFLVLHVANFENSGLDNPHYYGATVR